MITECILEVAAYASALGKISREHTLTGDSGLDWYFAKPSAPHSDTITDLDSADGELVN